MNFKAAQEDMRKAYFGGGPGAWASGIVWLSAGIMALISSQQTSVLVFFFGKGNPLAKLALESTFLIFIGLFIAYATLQTHPRWFYAIMVMIIGGRYLVFTSIYGMRIYWIFGAILVMVGVIGFFLKLNFHVIASKTHKEQIKNKQAQNQYQCD